LVHRKLSNYDILYFMQASNQRTLRDLRGVGKSIEGNFKSLGIHTVAQLARANGDRLYQRLNDMTGVRQDPCVLDTFRCAVAQAKDPALPIDQTNWWWWSRKRKQTAH
jgi:hypothetical protein